MTTDPNCPFCAIANGEGSTEVIREASEWVAFFPLRPATPGHTLVIPRVHVTDLWDADLMLAESLMDAVVRLGRAIRDALVPEGMNLITSSGSAAEQSIFHLHLHVVPRWQKDGFGRIWPPASRYEDDALLEGVAERIRHAWHD